MIWKLRVPFKYKLLFWNLCIKLFPLRVFLSNRIPNFDASCVQCSQGSETLLHLFRDCMVTKTLWLEIIANASPVFSFDFFILEWENWLISNLRHDDVWKLYFSTSI